MNNILRLLVSAAIAANVLAGCSGSSKATAPVATTPPPAVTPPAKVTGIATPKTVSVVTAN